MDNHIKSFFCDSCKKGVALHSKFTTGYGIKQDGTKYCYSCIEEMDAKDLETMPIGSKNYLYLTEHKGQTVVTNWPGSLRIKIPLYAIKKGLHNIARTRVDVWFTFRGSNFWGAQYGNDSQILHVRKVK